VSWAKADFLGSGDLTGEQIERLGPLLDTD
jgi:hypothetical protein